jgi:hypothetical protein
MMGLRNASRLEDTPVPSQAFDEEPEEAHGGRNHHEPEATLPQGGSAAEGVEAIPGTDRFGPRIRALGREHRPKHGRSSAPDGILEQDGHQRVNKP